MFTGIIQKVEKGFFTGSTLKFSKNWKVEIGESIAVNGVCLTVSKIDQDYYYFDIGEETKRKTNLSKSEYFNLEKSLKVGDKVSGHFVTGHVDGMVRLINIERVGNTFYLHFSMPKERWAIVEKGCIALNGISLTIAGVSFDSFFIQVIPYTYQSTNLKFLKSGDLVNYEIDIFARYLKGVVKWNG